MPTDDMAVSRPAAPACDDASRVVHPSTPDRPEMSRLMLDALPAFVWVKDRQGRYVEVNAAFAAAAGRDDPHGVIGLTDLELWPEATARAFRANDDAVMDAGETRVFEERVELAGLLRWYESTKRPWRADDGRIVGTVGVAHDITQRRRVREIMAARLRLVDLAPHGSLDDLLRATLDEAESLTGSMIGFYHFVAPDQRTLVLQMWSTRTTREFCTAQGKGLHYSVDKAGVWVDCIRERRAVIHNDYASLPNRAGLPEGHAPVLRELVVPVFREGQIVAVMGVGNRPTPYGDEDVVSTAQLADLAWDIADRKRSEDALRESEQRYRELFEAESDAILLIDNASGCVLEANSAAGMLYGYTRDELRALHEADLRAEAAPLGLGFTPMAAPGAGLARSSFGYHRTRAGAVFPVDVTGRQFTSGGREITIMAVRDVSERQRYEDQLAEQHRRLAEAYSSLQALVVTDGLTGLLNRRAYDTRIIEERSRALRGKPLSILMIDVDRFKDFNDRFGHAAGDDVLAKVARLLLGATRGTDSVARYGGEEFVVIAPEADAVGAQHLAERCRVAVEAAAWPMRNITISVGVATWTIDQSTLALDRLALAADRALYAAKRGGRNRVSCAADAEAASPDPSVP